MKLTKKLLIPPVTGIALAVAEVYDATEGRVQPHQHHEIVQFERGIGNQAVISVATASFGSYEFSQVGPQG